ADAHLEQYAAPLLGPLATALQRSPTQARWRYGFIEFLAIGWTTDGADKYRLGWGDRNVVEIDAARTELAAVLAHESMRLATGLALIAVPCEAAADILAHPALDRIERLEIQV